MASQVFYRKYRSQTLAEIVGQEQVTQTLLNALKNGRVSHAYLFCGPRGTGKTSTGRILAKAVNCLTDGKGEPCNTCPMCQAITEGRALDMIEIDAASNRGIDDIRELRERVNYAPNQARYKVYIIDEAHMLTKEASNALLKTLEEPPPHVIFVLATTEAHKIIPTILSRCQRFDFHRISQTDIISTLTRICSTEGINMEPEALRLVARAATGSLRDAENLLEQLTTYYGADIGFRQVQAILGITGDFRTKELVKHIINNDISAGIITINSVNSDGLDLKQFNRELVEYLRGLLLIKTGADQSVDLIAEDIAELKDLAAGASLAQILKAVKLFGQLDLGFDNYSTLPLELALVDCALPVEKIEGNPVGKTEHEASHPVKAVTSSNPKQAAVKPKPAIVSPPAAPEATAAATPPRPEPLVAKPKPVAIPPTAAPEAIAAITPPEPGSELEQLELNWKQVVAQAPENTKKTPAIAILRSAGVKPVAFEDNTVVLSFKYPLHKEKIEQPENKQVIEKIISNFLGHPCLVRCIYQPEANHLVQEAQRLGARVTGVEEK